MNNNITFIIPIHKKLNEAELIMFKNAFDSIYNKGKIICIGPKSAKPENLSEDCTYIINNEKTDFSSQINMAVEKVTTDFFSIVEFDDEVCDNWLDSFEEYSKEEDYSASLYLPITELHENGNFIGFVNEALWASSFSEEIGFLDMECLNNYNEFNITGGIFNTRDFVECGGLKPSIKLSFWYEFLLRFVNTGKKVFVVPKIGYIHTIGRTDSLMDIYSKTIEEKEATWWMDLAKKEYFFKKDREKKYN